MPGPSPALRCALTAPFHHCLSPGVGTIGCVFSVALSRGSPRVAVSHHRALSCSDFPPARLAGGRPTHSFRFINFCSIFSICCGDQKPTMSPLRKQGARAKKLDSRSPLSRGQVYTCASRCGNDKMPFSQQQVTTHYYSRSSPISYFSAHNFDMFFEFFVVGAGEIASEVDATTFLSFLGGLGH